MLPTQSEPVAEGTDPIKPLRDPKHDYFSMHPAPQFLKPRGDLMLLDLFGPQDPSVKGPTLPDFDLPIDRPGSTPWTPADDGPERPGTLDVATIPAPAPGAAILLAGALAARRRGRDSSA